MLFPQHPRPVARRRAVPEVSVAWTQPAVITTGHVLDAAPRPTLVAGEGGAAMAPICFSVAYRLREYLGLVGEQATARLLARARDRGRDPGARLRWPSRVALAATLQVFGPPLFWMKKRRMPVCHFTLDEQGLVRETCAGTLRLAWVDVVAVHRHRGGWLVDKGTGMLPLPRRCFDPAQRAALERLLLSRFGDDTPV
jgi:hypothetical protein